MSGRSERATTGGDRRAFAIVLVAGLAGLVFLLGASLVAISQLQSAAANYDQRVRLAREHARAALDMAVGDLQQYAGRDQVATYLADAYRAEFETDFKVEPSASVPHPFWTAAYEGTTETWLVTRPMESDFNGGDDGQRADPLREPYVDSVTLLGSRTVESMGGPLEVTVPRESVRVNGLDGYAAEDERAIGHYAYWVGDSGVKASYTWYDKTGRVLHNPYGATELDAKGEEVRVATRRQERLRQLRISRPNLRNVRDASDPENPVFAELVDSNEPKGESMLSNPERIDRFASDFQFRDRFGGAGATERYLLGLTESATGRYFHDFTPLARGLLANSAVGGLKFDLSAADLSPGDPMDADLRSYAEWADALPPDALELDGLKPIYAMRSAGGGLPALRPILSQFNLRVSLWVEYEGVAEARVGTLKVSYNVAFELWNPYTSWLEKEGKFQAVVRGLPTLEGEIFVDNGGVTFSLDLADPGVISQPRYDIFTDDVWAPGEIRLFSGGQQFATVPSATQGLTQDTDSFWDPAMSSESDHTFNDDPNVGEDTAEIRFRFVEDANIEVDLFMVIEEQETLLDTYSLAGLSFSTVNEEVPFPLARDVPDFGFAWELKDEILDSSVDYSTATSAFVPEHLLGFDSSTTALRNKEMSFATAEVNLLGVRPNSDPGYESYFIPIAELPQQELTSVSMLRRPGALSTDPNRIGEQDSSDNIYLDSHFFSTVSRASAAAEVPLYPLPNTQYEVVGTTDMRDLQAPESAQNLFVRGAFNVNSTSIDAWKAMLSGITVPEWSHVEKNEAGEDQEVALDVSGASQFFNYAHTAQQSYGGFDVGVEPEVPDPMVEARKSFRRGMVLLSQAQAQALATKLVRRIRLHIQTIGPFRSLRDFADSGVLDGAMLDAGIDLGPEAIAANRPGYLSQRAIFNAIGPYLTARSDTFLVRAYGDAVNPADESEVWARAYCEAVVQRVHRKHASDADPTNPMSPTSVGPGEFGRAFEVVSFRWLSPSEL